MRTAHILLYRGVSLTETPPDRDAPWTETPKPCEQNDTQV